MKLNLKLSGLILLLLANLSCKSQELSKVLFLQGTWQIENKNTFETWELKNNQLEGVSYKLINNEKKITETLKIKIFDNQFIYEATVPNQNNGASIEFVLNKNIENTLSFENLAHDFPKKIQYQKISDTVILVTVLGDNNKGFRYKLLKQL